MAVIFSQPNNGHKRLFIQTQRDSSRYVFVIVLSCVLIFSDSNYRVTDPLRRFFSILTTPLQYASDYPMRLMTSTRTMLFSKQQLITENDALHQKQLRMQAKLQRFQALRRENDDLKDLLSLADVSGRRSIGARVLAIDANHNRQLVVLDKGQRDKLFLGQPVLDQHGVLGQVIDVGLMTSTVLLISDGMSAVPVRNNRTSEPGILVGTNKIGHLLLIHLPKTSTIREGDLLVTSGLGRLYPEGYPVGQVASVVSTPGDDFIKVRVHPLASLDRARLVLLIWPDEHHALLSKKINERWEIHA